jgi:TonB family protein
MSYRDRRRPFDAWDPYRDEPTPGRRSRWAPRRLVRIAIPLLIATATFGHDLWRLFEPDHRAAAERTQASPDAEPAQPVLESNRLIMPDPRKQLPRHAMPADSPGDWLNSDDYPASALRENVAGVVKFRFTIQPDGHVRDCVPIASSGSALLDSTACGIFTLHARYWPARDARGRAIVEVQSQSVRWQIPKD